MGDTWSQLRAYLNDRAPIVAGGLAGVVGLVISFAGRGVILGPVLGDPLPLALSVGQLLRSFLYFNWRAPLFHLLFAAVLGLLAVFILRYLQPEVTWRLPTEAVTAARIAAVINVGVVALLEVDALIVALWYLMAAFISIFATTTVARRVAGYLTPTEQDAEQEARRADRDEATKELLYSNESDEELPGTETPG